MTDTDGSQDPKRPQALRIETEALSPEASRQMYKTMHKSLRELWAVVDGLAAVMPPRPTYYRVTIFGSSRMHAGDELYLEVRRLAQELAAMGCDIITGGGPGLMEAANEGAAEADPEDRTRSVGIRVSLPFEQSANEFIDGDPMKSATYLLTGRPYISSGGPSCMILPPRMIAMRSDITIASSRL